MRIFWDERRIERLEAKVDEGFAAVRSEARADFRSLIAIFFSMFLTMIFGFAGVFVAILLQHT
jgi:hypothetical protein